MKKVLRTGLVTVVVLALLVIGVSGYGWSVLRAQFPQVSGNVKIDGLKGNVEIIRDRFGVPHIYADTPEDLFRAQGYVHAQDRFFQMEFWRRIGQGRLAELFGESALEDDAFIRTVGWMHVVDEEVKQLDPEMRSALESYAAGVNAYTLTHPDQLGLEFKVLGLIGRTWKPEPWLPAHSLTWAKAMAWNLGGNLDAELQRAALMSKGGEALTEAVLPPYPADGPVIVRTSETTDDGRPTTVHATPDLITPSSHQQALTLLKTTRALAHTTGLVRDAGEGIGSNNWVVSGKKTATGKPILSNDPHLGVQVPSIWYQVGLHCRSVSAACPYNVVGVSFASAPGVVIGHNARIAWGVTNVEPDTQDLVIEKPNPNNPDEFEYMGKFEAAQVREEVINVAGKAPITLNVRVTRHGPIISDVFKNIKKLKLDQQFSGQAFALQWAALKPQFAFRAVLKIDQAQNWDEFREALRDWAAPSQNFIFADVDGNIGYQMPGQVPIRRNSDGKAPAAGWNGDADWTGFIDFEQLPKLYNPSKGYIVTANNAVTDAQYPYLLTHDWDRGYRARRIEQLITAKDKLSVEDMTAIQMDSHAAFADDVMPLLKDFLQVDPSMSAPESVGKDPNFKRYTQAWEMLNQWDRVYTRNSTGATIFEAFWKHLSHNIFEDEMGADLAKEVLDLGSPTKLAVANVLANRDAPWWDDVTTPRKEMREDIVYKSMSDALNELSARLGNDMQQWQWGKVHTITFKNQTLGKSGVAPIEALFNRGPYPVDGTTSTVNAENASADFSVQSHPSWRMVVDLANWNNSTAVHPTGQSGHTGHPHYADMMALWLEGRTQAFLWQRADVEQGAEGVLVAGP